MCHDETDEEQGKELLEGDNSDGRTVWGIPLAFVCPPYISRMNLCNVHRRNSTTRLLVLLPIPAEEGDVRVAIGDMCLGALRYENAKALNLLRPAPTADQIHRRLRIFEDIAKPLLLPPRQHRNNDQENEEGRHYR